MYLENYQPFIGTGEKNAQGMDLKEFLEAYNPRLYDNPSNTVDNLIFTYKKTEDNMLSGASNAVNLTGNISCPANQEPQGIVIGDITITKLLMIKRGNHPCIGWWALPGGFVDYHENLDVAAARELKEETGIEGLKAVCMGTFGDYDRDPRTRIITTAYISLVEENQVKAKAGDDAADAAWFDVKVEDMGIVDADGNLQKEQSVAEVSQKIFTNAKEGIIVRRKKLIFTSGKLTIDAKVDITTDSTGILIDKKYTMVETNLVSADHAAIIMNAIDFIKERRMINGR